METEMKRHGSLKAWKKKLLLVVMGLIFGLFMSEIFLRVLHYSYPQFYTADYYRGVALRPNVSGMYRREGENYVSINSAGLRDREHAKAKPADTLRIAVLGDSYCEALQVPLEETFWSLLSQKLESCHTFPGKHVEIINFGVSGYGTGQELITLEQSVWDYSPDIVLLLMTTNNDITDNVRALKQANDIPYFVYQDGKLARDTLFRESSSFRWRTSKVNKIGAWFRDNLRVVQLIDYVQLLAKIKRDERRQQQAAAAATPDRAANASATPVSVENMIYREPADDTWKQAWQITEELIRQIRDEVNGRSAKFLLVAGSNPIQVHPDRAVRERFQAYVGTKDIWYPNSRLAALANREQINFLDLASPMQSYADQNHVFLHGFGKDIGNGHWNTDAHRVAADLIAQRLCQ